MRSWCAALILVLSCAAAAACGRNQTAKDAAVTSAVQQRLDSAARPAYVRDDDASRHVWQEERRFYKQNGYRAVWVHGTRPRPQLAQLVEALRAAGADGLEPAAYRPDDLDTLRRSKLDEGRAADLDVEA